MVHEFIMIRNKIHIFQNANTTLTKHWKTKRTYFQKKATFSQKNFKVLLAKKNQKKHSTLFDDENAGPSKKNKIILQQCGVCNEMEHNAQTC